MNNRLLSEEEALQATTGKQIAAAQLTKADKEWVELMPIMWAKCWTNTCLYMTPDCDFLNNACMAWAELKREVGQ